MLVDDPLFATLVTLLRQLLFLPISHITRINRTLLRIKAKQILTSWIIHSFPFLHGCWICITSPAFRCATLLISSLGIFISFGRIFLLPPLELPSQLIPEIFLLTPCYQNAIDLPFSSPSSSHLPPLQRNGNQRI